MEKKITCYEIKEKLGDYTYNVIFNVSNEIEARALCKILEREFNHPFIVKECQLTMSEYSNEYTTETLYPHKYFGYKQKDTDLLSVEILTPIQYLYSESMDATIKLTEAILITNSCNYSDYVTQEWLEENNFYQCPHCGDWTNCEICECQL